MENGLDFTKRDDDMATWWKACTYANDLLTKVEVVGETQKYVETWYGRRNKTSANVWYRPTREEAKACLVEYRKEQLDFSERAVERARKALEDADAL
jgi:hypothetical protein